MTLHVKLLDTAVMPCHLPHTKMNLMSAINIIIGPMSAELFSNSPCP